MCLSKAYKVVGSKGRIYLPKEIQEAANLYPGQIVRLEAEAGRVIFTAVSIWITEQAYTARWPIWSWRVLFLCIPRKFVL